MKKILLLFIFLLIIVSCISDVNIGYPKSTDSVEESIEKKYFLSEYMPSKRDFNVNSNSYKIKEVWSEVAWTYKNRELEESKLNYCHFLISFNQERVGEIDFKNENFENNSFSWRNNKLYFILKEEERNKDSIKLYFFINKDTIPVIFVKKTNNRINTN